MEDSSEDDHASSGLVIPSSGSVSSSPGNSNTKCRPSLTGTGGSVSSRNSQRRSTRSGRWDEISETDSGWSDVYRDDDDDSLEDFDNASNSLHGNHTNHSLDLERIEEDNVVLHVRMKKQQSSSNHKNTTDCRDDEYDSEDEFWNSSGDWDGNDTTTEGSAAPPNATELQMEQDNNTLVLEHAQNTAQLNGMNSTNMSQMMESSDVTRSPDSPTKRASATINSVNGNRRRFSSSQNGDSSSSHPDDKSEATRQPKNGLSLPLQASPSNRVPPSQRRMSTNKQPSVSTLSSEKPDQPGQRHNLSVPLGLDPEAEEEEDEESELNDNNDDNYWDDSEEESDGGWDDVDDSDSNWDDDEEDEADWDEEIFKEYDEEKRKALIKQRSSKRALQKRMSSRKKLQKRLSSRKGLQKQGSSKKRISNAAIAATTVDGDEPDQQQQEDDTLAADSISTLTEDLTALDSRASNDSTPQPAAPKPPQFPKQEKRQSFRNSNNTANNNKQRQSFPKQHSRQRFPKQPSRQSFRNNQPNQPSRTLIAPRPPEEQRPPPTSSSGAASVSTSRSSRSKPRTPEDWEQLYKTWEKIERKKKKKANGSRRTSSKNTAQTQPIIEEEGEAMADDSSKQQQNGKKSCFGEHVFPFKFLSKKKKGR